MYKEDTLHVVRMARVRVSSVVVLVLVVVVACVRRVIVCIVAVRSVIVRRVVVRRVIGVLGRCQYRSTAAKVTHGVSMIVSVSTVAAFDLLLWLGRMIMLK